MPAEFIAGRNQLHSLSWPPFPAENAPITTKRNWFKVYFNRREYREEFLTSPAWKDIRARVLAKQPACERCTRFSRDVHHLIYRQSSVPNEDLDLMALCRRCHNLAHVAIDLGLISQKGDPTQLRILTRDLSESAIAHAESITDHRRLLPPEFLFAIQSYASVATNLTPHAYRRILGILKINEPRPVESWRRVTATESQLKLIQRTIATNPPGFKPTRRGIFGRTHKPRGWRK